MSLTPWSFLGLSSEQGQPTPGLCDSPRLALDLLKTRFQFKECILIDNNSPSRTFHNANQFTDLNWHFFKRAFHCIRRLLIEGDRVLNWGGDHSVGMATVASFTSIYTNGYVLWIDAHADLNTPSASLSGNFHGMPLSILLGLGNPPSSEAAPFWAKLDPKRLIYFGLRDLDPFEENVIKSKGITSYFCRQINSTTIESIIEEILCKIGHQPLHISFDIDSMDPSLAPSTGVQVSNGLQTWQLQYLARRLKDVKTLKSIDIVEINPRIGSPIDVANTFSLAINFLEHFFESTREGLYDSNFSTIKNQLQIPQPWHTPFWA